MFLRYIDVIMGLMKEISAVGIKDFFGGRDVFNKETGAPERSDYRYVEPSKDLLKKMDELSAGSKVGIEYYPYSETIVQGEIQKLMNFSSYNEKYWNGFFKSNWNNKDRDYYWNEIIEECEKRNLKVIFLESYNDHKKYCEYLGKCQIYGEAEDSIQSVELGFDTYKGRIKFLKEQFKDDPEFFKEGYDNSTDLMVRHMSLMDYQRYIGTPNNVIRNMIKNRPDLVILSKRTLDYWKISGKPGTAICLPSDPKIKIIGMEVVDENGWEIESDSISSNLVDYVYGESGKEGEEKRKEIADLYVKWIVANDIQVRNI